MRKILLLLICFPVSYSAYSQEYHSGDIRNNQSKLYVDYAVQTDDELDNDLTFGGAINLFIPNISLGFESGSTQEFSDSSEEDYNYNIYSKMNFHYITLNASLEETKIRFKYTEPGWGGATNDGYVSHSVIKFGGDFLMDGSNGGVYNLGVNYNVEKFGYSLISPGELAPDEDYLTVKLGYLKPLTSSFYYRGDIEANTKELERFDTKHSIGFNFSMLTIDLYYSYENLSLIHDKQSSMGVSAGISF
ncbi:hypothetical protein J4N42_10985 [Vibrio sp. SCSIO 43135]|uniref:hypothetical protein n=1 Tax=Vibrio sp. SCSIO 43135 TaxID=2819096 RepID=UPI00207641B2|nr:hypothetical protein [Vibrio sp. SCSIO 43135]USD40571.1 hypothetical protein J4N42_10985 [Vibrio sp. SCSIO 43135]